MTWTQPFSSQVDDGDVAFVIRAMFSPHALVAEKKKFNRQGILYAIDPVVNLATVNYILHGLQRYGFDKKDHKYWNTLWIALGIDQHFSGHPMYSGGGNASFSEAMKETNDALKTLDNEENRTSEKAMDRFFLTLKLRSMRRKLVNYLVKHVIKPFGIPRGSEKQGVYAHYFLCNQFMDVFLLTSACLCMHPIFYVISLWMYFCSSLTLCVCAVCVCRRSAPGQQCPCAMASGFRHCPGG